MAGGRKVILALDVLSGAEALNLARDLSAEVAYIKVNWPLVMTEGIRVVRDLSRYSPIICDFKVADIPNTNMLIARKAKENGAWGIISHQFTGRDSMEALVKEAGEMKVFSVVSMSNGGSRDFMDQHTDELIKMSQECGVFGYVAPGNNPEMLRKVRAAAGKRCIISPGMGSQGGRPEEAIREGADYIIIGRSVYSSDDPLGYLKQVNRNLSSL
jgi:orotidine-5'-phosphate decarboxylase